MKTRLMAVAFLINANNEILFLKKPNDHQMLPGYFVPIGGHMKRNEINNPKNACLREIEEEAGISENEVNDLSLRYVVHRLIKEEIRIQYIFISHLKKEVTLSESDEGTLHWLKWERIKREKITIPVKSTIEHYFNLGYKTKYIYNGTLNQMNGSPIMDWGRLIEQ